MPGLEEFVKTFGLPLGMLAFFIFATFIKDPPLFVSWREYSSALKRGDEALSLSHDLTVQNQQMVELMKGK